ncbi:hypothetical protein ElyMa_001576800 [Elysia marginata]|uniref:Uncharacterized protein n=1 Tax=Elysia marginata TaxID=1093978 RepID=A0AAV4JCW8_9GAST|nr:hypothetical protein ElyMa_001576800 [Elysia marginata]
MNAAVESKSRRVKWCDTPSVKTYITGHQYESCKYFLIAKPIDNSFANSPAFKAAEFMLGDDLDTMQLLIMATNYLHESLGRYPQSEELFGLLTEQGLTPEFIVQEFLDFLIEDVSHGCDCS